MQIKTSLLTKNPRSTASPQKAPLEPQPSTNDDSFNRGDAYEIGSAVAGGTLLGAGGAYLGLAAGINYGFQMGADLYKNVNCPLKFRSIASD